MDLDSFGYIADLVTLAWGSFGSNCALEHKVVHVWPNLNCLVDLSSTCYQAKEQASNELEKFTHFLDFQIKLI